jgi:hypothetical protein
MTMMDHTRWIACERKRMTADLCLRIGATLQKGFRHDG